MSMSNYLETASLNVYKGTAHPAPATVYLALYTFTPSDAGGGTEVTGGSYARLAITCNGTNFNVTGGTLTNSLQLVFPTATAYWGIVVAWGLFDAAIAGNLWDWGVVSTNKAIANGSAFVVNASGLTISRD